MGADHNPSAKAVTSALAALPEIGVFFLCAALVGLAVAGVGSLRGAKRVLSAAILTLCVLAIIVQATLHASSSTALQIVFASILGVLIGPFLIAMFDRDTLGEAELAARATRLRVLGLAIGVAALLRLGAPYIDTNLGRTSNLEVGLLKLTFFDARIPSRDLDTTPGAGAGAISDNLTRAARSLSRIVALTRSGDVPQAELAAQLKAEVPFVARPMIARDALVAVHFVSQGRSQEFHARVAEVATARETFERSFLFASIIATPLNCVLAAAELTRDYRLVMLDVHPVVRWLTRHSIETPAEWQPSVAPADPETSRNIRSWVDLVTNARNTVSEALGNDAVGRAESAQRCPGSQHAGRLGPPHDATEEAALELQRIALADPSLRPLFELKPFFGDLIPGESRQDRLARDDLRTIQRAPYVTMAAAWLYHGIGGTESAVALLTRWLNDHGRRGDRQAGTTDLRRAIENWLWVRAVIELDLLIGDDVIDSPNDVLPGFYSAAFDRVAEFLPDPARWVRERCRSDAAPPADRLLHETEQSLYFALANLKLRQFRAAIAQHRLTEKAVTTSMVEEARALAEGAHHCFGLVPTFKDNPALYRGQWLAYLGYLEKAYVEGLIVGRPNERQTERLRSAARALDAAAEFLRDAKPAESSRAFASGGSPREGRHEWMKRAIGDGSVYVGTNPADSELARVRRARRAISPALGEA